MREGEEDWEGFQSQQFQINFMTVRKTPKKIEIINLSRLRSQEQTPQVPRKNIIRTKNKRKNSQIFSQINPKSITQIHSQPISQPKLLQIDKNKKISKTFEPKQDSLPVYREPTILPSNCTIIYRGFQPTLAREYFCDRKKQTIIDINDEQLIFDSHFECGNLDMVLKLKDQYHLHIAADTNTKGHRQWFFFSVLAQQNRKVKLYIHSFKKKLSLFQMGMKPYGKMGDSDWQPIGSNIRYLRQDFRQQSSKQNNIFKKQQFFLSFELQLKQNVKYQIASCIPYSFSYLQARLNELHIQTQQQVQLSQTQLCTTLTGLKVPLLTLKSTINDGKSCRFIVINARTHPGQSSSSWVLDGLLKQLVSSHRLLGIMRQENIVIKIVPMLNVEGVHMGNYRTGIVGIDFNRLFLTGKHDVFPQVAAIKQLVKDCKFLGKIDLYLDLHGHSILPGCFFYGPDPYHCPKTPLKHISKDLKQSKYFANNHCIMGVDNSKIQTSRIFFQIQQGVYSLTLQNSLGLFLEEGLKNKPKQFQANDWQHFGKQLINTILGAYSTEKLQGQHFGQHRFRETTQLLKQSCLDNFEWTKSKTEEQSLVKHIRMLQNLQSAEIQVVNPLSFSQNSAGDEIGSMNDSDNESDNLSERKQHELFKIAQKTVKNEKTDHNRTIQGQSPQRDQIKFRINKEASSKAHINSFKQYRFGHEDNTLSQWYTRRRLLSVPRPLKNQKINQSYIIKRVAPRQASQEQLAVDQNQLSKRVKTEQRDFGRKTSGSRFLGDGTNLISRQKALLQHLISKRKE